jgi:type III pantothenate kinase
MLEYSELEGLQRRWQPTPPFGHPSKGGDLDVEITRENIQIGLSIGNSRYHWAWFLNTKLQSSWDTEYIIPVDAASPLENRFFAFLPIDLQAIINNHQIDLIPIYLISVVPSQTAIWQQLPQVKSISLADIPLLDLYPTLGIDRALAAFGAGETYGYPVLVIDGGTALTITGIDANRQFIGGAILPGLRLQLCALSVGTAALPEIILPQQLPPRWSNNTPDSIASGILYTVIAGISDFIRDWQQLYPQSHIIFTGGDGVLLSGYLQANLSKHLGVNIKLDRQLLFNGLSALLN